MDKKNLKNRLVSVRIPAHVEDYIENVGIRWLGKDKTKSDFINEAIKVYCYSSLLMIEDKIGKKNIRPYAIDTITGKEKELSFEEYLEIFK